ncbi:hypothetical protein HYU07_00175 [Candidatus Woesearchaeota archaeon]|nr:hypothetical protein [Candidatus Woesearchaeota archaeon]
MGRNKKDIWRINKKGDFQFSPIIRAIIVILVVIVVIFLWNSTAFAGIKAFLGFKIPGQDQQIEPLTNYDFYNTFVKEYRECKLSPFKECRCKMTSLENRLPAGNAIELTENGGNVEISLVEFTLKYENDKCRFSAKEKDAAAEPAIIKNDALFTLDFKVAEKNKLTIFAITKSSGCPLEGTLIKDYSTGNQEDVLPAGGFSNHIARFESRTQFFSKDQLDYIRSKWEKLVECKAPKNAEEADQKFEAFIKEIDEFNSGSETTKNIKLGLPESYKIKLTGIEVSLYWSKYELTKSATSLCSTDKDLPNGNYLLTKTRSDPGITCVMTELQNP